MKNKQNNTFYGAIVFINQLEKLLNSYFRRNGKVYVYMYIQ